MSLCLMNLIPFSRVGVLDVLSALLREVGEILASRHGFDRLSCLARYKTCSDSIKPDDHNFDWHIIPCLASSPKLYMKS